MRCSTTRLDAEDVRKWSMEVSAQLFRQTDYRISGQENLPEQRGVLVIMNHLENHPDTVLPNQFRLTLDSHFVSSMILYPPFLLSEQVSDPSDKQALGTFVEQLQERYRGYVKDAAALAAADGNP